jgi:hypothetical protein
MGASAGGHLSLMQGTAGTNDDPKAKDPIDRESSRVQAVCLLSAGWYPCLKARGARWKLANVRPMASLVCVRRSLQWNAYWSRN